MDFFFLQGGGYISAVHRREEPGLVLGAFEGWKANKLEVDSFYVFERILNKHSFEVRAMERRGGTG